MIVSRIQELPRGHSSTIATPISATALPMTSPLSRAMPSTTRAQAKLMPMKIPPARPSTSNTTNVPTRDGGLCVGAVRRVESPEVVDRLEAGDEAVGRQHEPSAGGPPARRALADGFPDEPATTNFGEACGKE